MKRITEMIRRLEAFDPEEAILEAALHGTDEISQLVSDVQMYEQGVRGLDGEDITPPYTFVTVKIKTAKGQPTDRVTLRDTGDFHKSFHVRVEGDAFEVDATDPKTEKLKDKYGEGIMALTDEHLDDVVSRLLRPAVQNQFKAALYGSD